VTLKEPASALAGPGLKMSVFGSWDNKSSNSDDFMEKKSWISRTAPRTDGKSITEVFEKVPELR
jgi:hypothetical protein